eukprot:6284611-Pyramimonas_sp.AAC.1
MMHDLLAMERRACSRQRTSFSPALESCRKTNSLVPCMHCTVSSTQVCRLGSAGAPVTSCAQT